MSEYSIDLELKDFGKVPIFLPDATRGAIKSITTRDIFDVGTKALVTNTLHLTVSPGSEKIKELGGIKKFMNWDGIVLTDSGGFQVFSLLHSKQWEGKVHDGGATFKSPKDGKVIELTPESSIDIQMNIGSDIMVVLDDCRKSSVGRKDAEISVARTLEWAQRCRDYFDREYGGTKETGKILTAVVQGANFLDLREHCAKALAEIGFDGYNFGGYLLDDDGNLVVDELACVLENTPDDKFNYAMGLGKPSDIIKAIEIGYTVFDTVLVTRNARHGSVYSFDIEGPEYKMNIKNAKYANDQSPIDSTCDCQACKYHTRAYIHQMIKVGEITGMTLASIHNLRFYNRLVEGKR